MYILALYGVSVSNLSYYECIYHPYGALVNYWNYSSCEDCGSITRESVVQASHSQRFMWTSSYSNI